MTTLDNLYQMLDMSAVESLPEQQTAPCQLNTSVLIKLTLPRGEKNVHHSNIQVS